jgi:hypothetical protein
MQYLLTEDEMAEVRRLREVGARLPSLEALTNIARHVACQMAEVGNDLPNGRQPTDKPHGCIHVDGSGPQAPTALRPQKPWYCDRCPAAGFCPQPKEWSK